MSTADRELPLAVRQPGAIEIAPAGRMRGAEELASLLSVIADQIAESDKRHIEVLSEMRERLTALSEDTRAVRTQVAGDLGPVFTRIEGALNQLGERMSEVQSERITESRPQRQQPETAPVAGQNAPAALRSAAPAAQQAFQRGLDTVRGASHLANVDTFDVVDVSMPQGGSEAWDTEQAEALTRVYEAEPPKHIHCVQPVQVLPQAEPAHEAHRRHGIPASVMVEEEPHAAAAALQAPGVERAWLEAKFAEIASRIEQSLAEMTPNAPLDDLAHRFDLLEQSFGDALHDVASRADLEGLRQLEGQIAELGQHVEQTYAQLVRLDGIEHQISTVIQQLADQRLNPAAAPQAGFEAADIERVVEVAAEQAVARFAERIPAAPAPAESHDGAISDIRSLLEGYIAERRQGDEQTISMLDTLQQALIRVLDRVDAIEVSQATARHEAYENRDARATASDPYYGDHGYSQHGGHVAGHPVAGFDRPGAQAFAAEDAGQAMRPAPLYTQWDAGLEAEPAERARAQPLGRIPVAHEPASGADQEPHAESHTNMAAPAGGETGADPGAASRAVPQAQAAPRSPIEKLRQDFIADAQRAKLRAAAETSAAPAGSKGAEAQGMGGVLASSKKPSGGSKILGLSPKFLVLALVAVLAINGAMLMFSGSSSGPEPAALPPAAQEKSRSQGAGGADKTAPQAAPKAQAPAGQGGAQGEAPREAPKPRSDLSPESNVAAAGRVDPDALQIEDSLALDTSEGAADALRFSLSDGLAGLRIQGADREPHPGDFARLRHQQNQALLSGKVGADATEHMTPAAFLAEEAAPAAAGQQETGSGSVASRGSPASQLDLPPATVGPLSLRLAAAKGDPSAQFEVGARLAEGKGTNQNFKEAFRWYQRSASQGFAQAQYRLGTLFERGLGTKSDAAFAREWYKRAAEQGNIKAMHNLAVLSAASAAGSPDYATASRWFMMAAERGLEDSQFNLGVLYESGLGVGKDVKQAHKWYALAARAGDKDAARRRDQMRTLIAPQDLADADGMVADYKPVAGDPLANDARAAGEDWKKRQDGAGGNG